MATWNLTGTKHHILICNGGSCMRNIGDEVTQAIRDEILRNDADSDIHTTRTRCNGRCEDACVAILYPQGIWYRNVTPEAGKQLVREVTRGNVCPVSERIIYTYQNGFKPKNNTVPGIEKFIDSARF